MIQQPLVRDRLAEVFTDAGITVYSRAPQGSIVLPCVVIGMPDWKPRSEQGMDVWHWPVVVCVATSSESPERAVDQLDEAWPDLVARLQQVIYTDQTLGGLCSDCVIDGSTFGAVGIAGRDYPAQSINLKLYDI